MERFIRLMMLGFLASAFVVSPAAFAARKKPKDSKPSEKVVSKPSEDPNGDKEDAKGEKAENGKDDDAAEDKTKDEESDKPDKEKKDKDSEKSSEAKPKTHKVEKGPFKIEIELTGVFEAKRMEQIVLRPKQWTGLKVLDAVEHGQRVKKGELLVKFDMEKIDREIAGMVATLLMRPRSVARQMRCSRSKNRRAASGPPFTQKLIRWP